MLEDIQKINLQNLIVYQETSMFNKFDVVRINCSREHGLFQGRW